MSGFWQLSGVANMPVNQQGQKQRTIRKTFAPQKRGRPSFSLNSPTAVNTPPPVLRDFYALLAPKPRAKSPRFRGVGVPLVVNPFVPPVLVYTDAITVLLAPQKRGKTKPSVLRSPTVVTVATPQFYLDVISVSLAPQKRRKTGSFLVPPQAIVVYPEFGDTLVSLAPQRRGKSTPVLIRPIVVFAPSRALGWVAVNLVQPRNTRQTTTLLRPPTVTN